MGKPRHFKLNNNKQKKKNQVPKLPQKKRIIGKTPDNNIYGSQSNYTYDYMKEAPYEINDNKDKHFKYSEHSKFTINNKYPSVYEGEVFYKEVTDNHMLVHKDYDDLQGILHKFI